MRYTRSLKDRSKALFMAVIMLFSAIAPCISDLGMINKVYAATQSEGDVPTGSPVTYLDGRVINIGPSTHDNINYGNGIGIVNGSKFGYDYKSCEYLINYSVTESKERYNELMAVIIGNVDTSYACSSLTAHDTTTTTSGTNTWFTIRLNKDLYGLGIPAVYLHCDNPGLPYPTGLNLTITPLGRVTNEYTDDAGDTVKTVVVYYKMYGVTTVSGTQNGILYMAMAAHYKEENSGKLKLKKSSSNTNLTDNNTNGCYSLAGAKYSIFESESDARNSVLSCLNPKGTRITTGAVATLTTDFNGDSNVLTKDDGLDFTKTYYIVETTTPKGYKFENAYYKIDLNAKDKKLGRISYKIDTNNNVSWGTPSYLSYTITQDSDGDVYGLSLTDNPLDDPVTIFLQKNDAELQKTLADYDVSDLADAKLAQGDGYLANAIYELNYYDNLNSTNNGVGDYSGTPKYTWYFKTDENGRCSISGYAPRRVWNDTTHRYEFVYNNGNVVYDVVGIDEYYVPTFNGKDSSSLINTFVVQGKTIAQWPLGTYTLHEVQAPDDYLVSNVLYKFAVIEDSSIAEGVRPVGDITTSNGVAWISTTNSAGQKVLEAEQVRRYSFKFKKIDYDTKDYASQGNATLPTKFIIMNNSERDIIYDINNDGTYTKATELITTIKGNTIWTDEKIMEEIKKCDSSNIDSIIIDVNGDGINDVMKVVTLDSNGYGNVSGVVAGTYRVFELPNTAYDNKGQYDEFPRDFVVNKTVVDDSNVVEDDVVNQVKRAGVQVLKTDATTIDGNVTGGMSLADIEFTITNLSDKAIYYYATETDESNNTATVVAPNDSFVIKTKATVIDGKTAYVASTLNNALPYGKYSIQETKSNNDYKLTDNTVYYFEIDENTEYGTYVSKFTLANGTVVDNIQNDYLVIENTPYRGDFKFTKISEDYDTLEVPFIITNKETGEKHIIVTSENGVYSSKDIENSSNTNANDKFFVSGNTPSFISKNDFVKNSGLWFGVDANNNAIPVQDNAGSLSVGTYSYEEIASEDNYGRELISGEFTIISGIDDVITIEGNLSNTKALIDNDITPTIGTTAIDSLTGNHITYSNGQATFNDTVHMEGLIPNKEYTLVANIMDYDTNLKAIVMNGETQIVKKTFIATDTNMDVTVNIPIDTTDTTDMTFVIYENLYKTSIKGVDDNYVLSEDEIEITGDELAKYNVTGRLVQYQKYVAAHTDITDRNQTIELPGIKTTATDADTLEQYSRRAESVSINDIVTYSRLLPNETYTIEGTIYDKDTGLQILDSNGNPYKSSVDITPNTSAGDVTVSFTIDTRNLNGHTLVVAEKLIYNGIVLVDHKDMNDIAQTIYVPDLKTTLSDVETETHTGKVAKEVTLIDHAEYKNLMPGHTYRVEGILMDKDTGDKFVDANGDFVTSSTTFTPVSSNGTVDITFTFDTSEANAKAVVAFETVFDETLSDLDIVYHTDINSEEQSVYFPEIRTTAMDVDTNSHIGTITKNAQIVDIVNYKNLVIGEEYRIDGILMVKPEKEEDEPYYLEDKNGNPITSSTTFVANTNDGEIELLYEFDSSLLEGKTVVVFEDLYSNNIKVYSHADITDEDQTIYYPKLQTTITNKQTKTNITNVGEKTEIIDTVSYANLIVGKSYTVKGTLIDKSTGKAVKDKNGKTITGSASFTAKNTSGQIDVKFDVDSIYLEGKTLVAFEDLYIDNKKVATHSDINDEAQTLYIPKVRTTASDVQTKTNSGTISASSSITDIVKYDNLKKNITYKVTGYLVNKETGEPILSSDGSKITASKEFKPTKSSGEVTLTFTFDSTILSGTTVVVFEDIYYNSIKVATHSDINDINQTIAYPELHTTATDSVTKDHIGTVGETVKIIDEVEYHGLIPNKEYTISGILMDKATGKEFLDANKKTVTASETFYPAAPDGYIELEYTINKSDLSGVTIVVFEDLIQNGMIVATHSDIDDENQTVQFPTIKTTATDSKTKNHTGRVDKEVTIIDKVEYTNLIVGKTYTINGKLVDKNTGEAVLSNGTPVTASTTFKAEKSEGSIDLTYNLDSSLFGGVTTVVFEDLIYNEKVIVSHADLNDEEQTIIFPEIKTTATVNGKKEVTENTEVELIDTVTLKNLTVGESYTLSGKLMGKKSGKDINVDGYKANTSFTATATDMTVEVKFKVDSSKVGNQSVVVFEELYSGDIKIAGHEDLEDTNQTVIFKTDVKTGDDTPIGMLFGLMGIAIVGLVSIGFVIYKKRKK